MTEEIAILMIDDDEEDFIIIKDLFAEIDKNKYRLNWVSSYKEGLKSILEEKHDACLVDYRLGADNGLELINEALNKDNTTPLILLTGQNDINIDKQAMLAGASDYLVKGNISATLLERSIRYGIEQAKKIKRIKQLNADLEKKVEERTHELTEKINLIKEIHHRVRNNLQVITSLIHLQSDQIKDNLTENAFHSFETKIETMSMIYSMTYAKDSLLNIKLNDFIHNFKSYVLGKYPKRKIDLKIEIDLIQDHVNIDTAISFGLLLNEVLTNAIKFGYSNETSCHIHLHLNDDGQNNFVLKIKDKGNGIPDNVLINNKEFLGLNLIYDLTDQLDGKCERNSTAKGTNYEILFREIHRG